MVQKSRLGRNPFQPKVAVTAEILKPSLAVNVKTEKPVSIKPSASRVKKPKLEAKTPKINKEKVKARKETIHESQFDFKSDQSAESSSDEIGMLEKVTIGIITFSIFAYIIAKTAFERTIGSDE